MFAALFRWLGWRTASPAPPTPAAEPLPAAREPGSGWLAVALAAERRRYAAPGAHLGLVDAPRARESGASPRRSSQALSSQAMPASSVRPPRLRLAVDDAGEFLVVVATRATIGHLRARDVALPFLADVAEHHARLELVQDFHAGPRWRVTPEPGARVQVAGQDVPETGAVLADGDDVRLASNLAFRFVAKERDSASVRLELLGGAECLGVSRILLLVPGPGGRTRIGASAARLIPLADLEHEIEIAADAPDEPSASLPAAGASIAAAATGITVRCAAGFHGTPRAAGEPEVRLALPLELVVTLTVRTRAPGRPPFALVLSPCDGAIER